MKIHPALPGKNPPHHSWPRLVRRAFVCGSLLLLGASSAWAQISIDTLAGTAGSTGTTNATGAAARFNSPQGVAVDVAGGAAAGTVYVADAGNHAIRMITPAGVVTTLAGLAGTAGAANSTDGSGATARFNLPQGVALDLTGTTLYVADTNNHAIRRIVIATGATTTLAGSVGTSGTLDSSDGTGATARFNSPIGITVDNTGANLYVADAANHTIRRVVVSTGATTTIAGSSTGLAGAVDGTGWTGAVAGTARFSFPVGVTADATNLYVADRSNHAIRRIVIATGAVSTLAGTLGTPGGTDSPALFNLPGAVAVRGTKIYVADSGNHAIRQIDLGNANTTTTLAGAAGVPGSADAIGSAARFSAPAGIAVDGSNNVYIGDTNNHTIRRGGPTAAPAASTQPAAQSVALGGTATFAFVASGNPTPGYQWQRNPGGTGAFANLAEGGAYSGVTTTTLTVTGATAAMNGDQFRCVATNAAPGTVTSNTVTLTVTQPPVITSAAGTAFATNTAGSFQVVATGSPAPTFSYTGTLPGGVTLSSSGLLAGTPTSLTGSPFTITITATSAGVGSATQNFILTVQSGAAITTQPANQNVLLGANATFSLVASGTPATFTYQWYRQPAGTTGFLALANNSTYSGVNGATLTVTSTTQPMSGDQFQCVVSNGAGGPATSAAATLTVGTVPVFTSLASSSFAVAQASTYQVQATGGTPTYAITSVVGANPSTVGVTLSSTGLLSGTPTATTGSPFVFTITATNFAGSTNQTFTLTVLPAGALPAFTTQPANQTATIAGSATFTVVATGLPTPTYQWQRQPAGTTGFVNLTDGGAYAGTTTATLTVSGVTTGMTGDLFQCVATNTGGSTASTAASLTANIGTIITTHAGAAGVTGALDGTGAEARFSAPSAIAIDSAGNTYIADTVNSTIRKITPAGVVTTVAGLAGSPGNADGTTLTARLNGPNGIAVDGVGNLYVADTFNHTIRVITPAGNVTTLAGLAGAFGSTDDTGAAARFAYPTGLAVTSSGFVYVADSFNHTIRMVSPTGVVTTYAGVAGSRGSADGIANVGGFPGTARFASPNAVAVDSAGSVYVADAFNHTIRVITTVGNVTTLAGLATTPGSADGTGNAARFNQPSGLAVDSSGNVFVTDTVNQSIRKVTSAGVVTTLAGLAGVAGSADGTGSAARFSQPYSIAVDRSGNLFIADKGNNTIRRSGTTFAPSITTQPVNRAVSVGQSATFTVVATGSPTPNYQWKRQPFGVVGFTNLANDTTYGGVTTATLTVTGVTSAMNGDQFQCVVNNFISPDAVTNPVTLSSSLVAPVFTSASSTSVNVGSPLAFTVAASGTPAPTFTATGLPSWATLNATTGVITGTPPDAAGSPFSIALTATNGLSATQNLSLTVVVPVVAPTIATQPASLALNRGATASFSVTATGTAPLAYQWNKNGLPLTGANSATLTLGNIQAANSASYTVTVTNSVGSVTSAPAILVLNGPPAITMPPRSQTVLVGGTATLVAATSGEPAPSYQWRLNGVAVPGATGSTLTIANAQSANAGNYDVVVSNALGSVTSSLAQLTVATVAVAPVVMASPADRAIVAGGSTSLSVEATGVPAPAYQWRKNGAAISGANSATLALTGAQAGDAGIYDVVVTNAAGSTTSQVAVVKVVARSYAGIYFGSLGGAAGSFAFVVRDDNTGTFLGFIPGTTPTNASSTAVNVNDAGGFSFTAGAVTVAGTIAGAGSIAGSLTGSVTGALAGTKAADLGSFQAVAGYYQAGVSSGAGTAQVIVGATGQVYVLTQTTGEGFDGGTGVLDSANRATIATTNGSIAVTLAADGSTITVNGFRSNQNTIFTGASEAVIATQRLANISSRARVDSGSNLAVAGFVIAGQEAKPVLIRAIGPALASFGVPSALAAPKLDLYRSGTIIATNTGWASAGNSAAIVAATVQAGAFALSPTSADSVIFTTLPPGAYTAQVSAASGAPGVALIEVYDLSAAAAGQKLFNISTRANAGAGDATLIAGISIGGTVPKRVLIRAVGPGLAQFGLTGVLAVPQLQVIRNGVVVAQNAGVNLSPDAATIAQVSAQVGAFALPANSLDCALLISLAPGNYSATVTGAGGGTGIAIIEVYEAP